MFRRKGLFLFKKCFFFFLANKLFGPIPGTRLKNHLSGHIPYKVMSRGLAICFLEPNIFVLGGLCINKRKYAEQRKV